MRRSMAARMGNLAGALVVIFYHASATVMIGYMVLLSAAHAMGGADFLADPGEGLFVLYSIALCLWGGVLLCASSVFRRANPETAMVTRKVSLYIELTKLSIPVYGAYYWWDCFPRRRASK